MYPELALDLSCTASITPSGPNAFGDKIYKNIFTNFERSIILLQMCFLYNFCFVYSFQQSKFTLQISLNANLKFFFLRY